jgi:FKBP-type peptidyl-prolyl cis-trans isomerase
MYKFKLSIILLSSILVTHELSFAESATKKNKTKTATSASTATTKLADTSPTQIKRISGNNSTMSNIPTVLSHEVIKAAPQDAPLVKAGQTVTVNYTGWLHDSTKADKKGAQFDSSKKPGRTPFKFKVGGNMVIAGWDKGLQKMQIGGTYLLTIPSDMGYGSRGAGDLIPANAPLLFEIEVLSAS